MARGLERVTGVPGWAAATVGTALFGLLLAGAGFYNDVAWHIYLGRDKNLFTAPHVMIMVGLAFITAAAGLGILFASLDRVDTAIRAGWLRVPWSTVPLGVLGCTALAGFPLDDLWHHFYGIDVTMWSPTHLIMIMGASLSPLAAWFVLAEARVRPSDSPWARVLHTLTAVLVLAGLTAPLGEFAFGVPQFSQLYHPALIALAAGFALVAARLVLGRGGALLVSAAALVVDVGTITRAHSAYHLLSQRAPALYVGSAVAVELVGLLLGVRRRVRFSLSAGVGIGTLGLGVEWMWNSHAHQPWHTSFAVAALVISVAMGCAAAVVGAAYAAAIAPSSNVGTAGSSPGAPMRVPALAVVAAMVVIALGLAAPLPRRVSPVTAAVHVVPARRVLPIVGVEATLQVTVKPRSAATDAWWFQATSWQGGGLVIADMRRSGPGQWTSARPVPIGGGWKTLIRLHKGTTMMAVPVYFPVDPAVTPEIPALDRTTTFANERHYLLREERPGAGWFADVAETLILLIVGAWLGSLALAAIRIADQRQQSEDRRSPPTEARRSESPRVVLPR
ncbi:MAG: hypothetical protein JO086_15095 [Acidimicrobiia bacterium]|nr:hypothetical protein [Acidimicrobiia bacterium]